MPLGGLRRERKRLRKPMARALCEEHRKVVWRGLRPGQMIGTCDTTWCEFRHWDRR